MTASPTDDLASAERRIQELTRELVDSREQQAATAEILRVISGSPTDLERVFAEIAMSAARLCDAYDAHIFQVDDDVLRNAAHHGPIPPPSTLPLSRGLLTGRAVLDQQTIHIADLQAQGQQYPEGSEIARRLSFRTNLAVPLIRSRKAIGVISIRRTEVRPFTDRQIELLKTFADQAVIAIENTRLFNETKEALDRQKASADILAVISSSIADAQPVFDRILASCEQLFAGKLVGINLVGNDGLIRAGAYHGRGREDFEKVFPMPLSPDSGTGLAILERRVVHYPDVMNGRNVPEGVKRGSATVGSKACIFAPLLWEGRGLGAIFVARDHVGKFSEKDIALLKTFADQAVIAIENTRLFEAEQAIKRELTESLEQQTATADVLKVISRSALDVQKVLDALVESAARLCEAHDASIFQVFGDGLRLVAHHGRIPTPGPVGQVTFPLVRGFVVGRAVIDRRTIQVADPLAEADEYPESRKNALRECWRTMLAVPLVHAGEAIGAIVIRRAEVRPFTERQIELVNTFADQAVIAIENTRLFEAEQERTKELQARTRELTESLEYQTATSEVLNVISRSPSEVQPVFDVIARSASRLCGDEHAIVTHYDGQLVHLVAQHNPRPGAFAEAAGLFPLPADPRASVAVRAVVTSSIIHIPNIDGEDYKPATLERYRRISARAFLAVPIIHQGRPIGSVSVSRATVGPFSQRQINLLKTFADQAVIAIENTRLFEEVQARSRELTESLEQQTATADVLKVISRSALDLQRVLDALVESAARVCNAYDAVILQVFGDGLRIVAHHGQIPLPVGQHTLPLERGLITARAVIDRRTIQVADMHAEADEYPEGRKSALQVGYRTALAVPLVHAGESIGVILIRRAEVHPFTERQIELVNTFADQAVIAIENTRLFEEVQARTRELAKTVEDLEIASQHKNQFVANMSHELRTPLAAILGYAELIQEGFYEPQGPKSLDALTRIRSNGKHLLGLINTVLDIAKIESGQFTLNMAEYAIETIVETVRSATESLAQNKNLALKTEVAQSLPIGLGDEQRLTQVLLNLVGNALKFTDAGEVRVTAKATNGNFHVSVSDTGPGIPAEHQTRIFEQFQQVDSSNTRAKGGTGLGLAIAKQIVEMHAGRISVESTVGKGSIFRVELPTRAEPRKRA